MRSRALFAPLILLLTALAPAGVAPTPGMDPAREAELHKLLLSLTAPNPAERDRAEGRLAFLGPAVRPALIDAVRHGEIPELRARAGRALLRIPCDTPADSPGVRQILREYCTGDPTKRLEAIAKFGTLVNDESVFSALLRLMENEPSDDVRYVIAAQIIRTFSDEPHLQTLRSLEPTADTAPALVLVGWAWIGKDPVHGTALLDRALKLEAASPTQDDSLIDWVFYRVYEHDIVSGDYDAAAEVLREEAWRGNPDATGGSEAAGGNDGIAPLFGGPQQQNPEFDSSAPPALLALFVLHAQVGPLRGFERDLQTYHDYLAQPEILYTLARTYERCGSSMMADAYDRIAFAASGASGESRVRVATFLEAHGWYDQAEREYAGAVGRPGPQQPITDAAAFYGLSHVAGDAGDDARAARLLHSAIERLQQAGMHADDWPLSRDLSEYEWRLLRAARSRKDAAAIAQQLARFTPEQETTNPEVAIDVILALRAVHRNDEAAELFEKSYAALKRDLDAYPPEPTTMNGLAWLCARCDEHLDEALELATATTQIAGGDGAFLDTAAEANFHKGHRAEAVRLETRALLFQPGDRFMREQLKKYRGE